MPNDFYYLTKILNTFKLVVSGSSCQPSSLRAYFDDDSLACSSEEFFFQQKPLVRPVFKNMINAPYKTNIYKYSAFLSERVKVGSNIYSEKEIFSSCGSNSMKQFALRKLVIHYKKVILKVGYLITREGHQTWIKYTKTDEGSIQIINFDKHKRYFRNNRRPIRCNLRNNSNSLHNSLHKDICIKKLCSDFNIEWASVFIYEDEDCICLDRLKFS